MRSKDGELLNNICLYIERHCDEKGYGPTVRDIADEFSIGSTSAFRYMAALEQSGRIAKGKHGYESNELNRTKGAMCSVPILGSIPCGPLAVEEEYIEGYVKLPEAMLGSGKYYLLAASGDSMTGADINDGDYVLIRVQNTAEIGEIVVALSENAVTLKRLCYDEQSNRYYLHPENEKYDDIYLGFIEIQGVAVKIIKDAI